MARDISNLITLRRVALMDKRVWGGNEGKSEETGDGGQKNIFRKNPVALILEENHANTSRIWKRRRL